MFGGREYFKHHVQRHVLCVYVYMLMCVYACPFVSMCLCLLELGLVGVEDGLGALWEEGRASAKALLSEPVWQLSSVKHQRGSGMWRKLRWRDGGSGAASPVTLDFAFCWMSEPRSF